MVARMRWLPKLLGRPGESREREAARGGKVLREQTDAAGAARPPEPDEAPSEPTEPIEPACRPKPGDIVLAPSRQDQFGPKQRAEVVELYWVGPQEMSDVREPGTEAEPWSVHVESLEALPD